MGGQAFELRRGQGGEKMFLIDIMRCGHRRALMVFLNAPIDPSRKSEKVSRPPRTAPPPPWRGSGEARGAQSARESSSRAPATALPPRARAWYRGARLLHRSRSGG